MLFHEQRYKIKMHPSDGGLSRWHLLEDYQITNDSARNPYMS